MASSTDIRKARKIAIKVSRDSHPCTYSLLNPLDLRCQFCGKKRRNLSEQNFHEGDMHFDGTFETDEPFDFESFKPITLHAKFFDAMAEIPFIVTEAKSLDDGYWRYTVSASQIMGFC